MTDLDELFAHLDQLRRAERRVAMATLVATRGTSPRKEGAKMWVDEEGRVCGSVTIGGCVDARVIEVSAEVIETGESQLISMSLGDDEAWDLGLTCSGTLDILVERVDFTRPDETVLAAYEAVRAESSGAG